MIFLTIKHFLLILHDHVVLSFDLLTKDDIYYILSPLTQYIGSLFDGSVPKVLSRYESSLICLRQRLPTQLAAPLLAWKVMWWLSAGGRSPPAESHHITFHARCRRHRGE